MNWHNPNRQRVLDLAALAILLIYAWLAWASSSARGGVALDPVWAGVRERGTLRVAVDVGFRPFADQEGERLVGYDIALAHALGERLGVAIVFVPTGFDALYDSLTSGRADMIASALPYAPEQGYRARFSQFYFDAGEVLVVPSTSTIRGPEQLAAAHVGVALGSSADTHARRMLAAGSTFRLTSRYATPAAALDALRNGQLDAAITDHVSALSAVQNDASLRIAAALTSEPFALAFPRAAFQLEAEVNRALVTLREEGFFGELNQRWLR
ncbi:MAG: amino acid ABC transporter substrate-binding protein [Candidatus Viridilinea halotolerans]|uniref:Amino acid ABC transporter substrate-binding protein n=1 Tax=Candidatus Viridilinea halotolerans TaxID=2491704 RepID=A0A426UBS3_9CHLR|nr:MAG: amino acid ABC transporter substrate-binding protein [Candidatus Viridilinea halotolerans]